MLSAAALSDLADAVQHLAVANDAPAGTEPRADGGVAGEKDAIVYENTLRAGGLDTPALTRTSLPAGLVLSPVTLLVSVWLRNPNDANRYRGLHFASAPPVFVKLPDRGDEPRGLLVPVLADSCTVTFLRSRRVEYDYVMMNGRTPCIRALRVSSVPAKDHVPGQPPISLSVKEFVPRYLTDLVKPNADDDFGARNEVPECLRPKYDETTTTDAQ